MADFTVTTCTYDGTSGSPNPLCTVVGTVNGEFIYAVAFFAYLAAANDAGQMQAALTAILYNWYAAVYGYQFTPWPTPIPSPTFPATTAVATHVQGPYPQPPVTYSPALINSWSI